MKTIAIFILLLAFDCWGESGVPASPASVVIESVLIDGQTNLLSGQSPSITVRPGQKRVEIHFASSNVAVPDQGHYRFQLEGMDANWVEVSNTIVSYTRLPAGRYRFVVEAADTNGTWDGKRSSVMITVDSGRKLLLTRRSFISAFNSNRRFSEMSFSVSYNMGVDVDLPVLVFIQDRFLSFFVGMGQFRDEIFAFPESQSAQATGDHERFARDPG
jgi:hypothetical protein